MNRAACLTVLGSLWAPLTLAADPPKDPPPPDLLEYLGGADAVDPDFARYLDGRPLPSTTATRPAPATPATPAPTPSPTPRLEADA